MAANANTQINIIKQKKCNFRKWCKFGKYCKDIHTEEDETYFHAELDSLRTGAEIPKPYNNLEYTSQIIRINKAVQRGYFKNILKLSNDECNYIIERVKHEEQKYNSGNYFSNNIPQTIENIYNPSEIEEIVRRAKIELDFNFKYNKNRITTNIETLNKNKEKHENKKIELTKHIDELKQKIQSVTVFEDLDLKMKTIASDNMRHYFRNITNFIDTEVRTAFYNIDYVIPKEILRLEKMVNGLNNEIKNIDVQLTKYTCISCLDCIPNVITCENNHAICLDCCDPMVRQVSDQSFENNQFKFRCTGCTKQSVYMPQTEFLAFMKPETLQYVLSMYERFYTRPKEPEIIVNARKIIFNACKNCNTMFEEFDACTTILCSCKKYMCWWCGDISESAEQGHQHLKNCRFNIAKKDVYFGDPEEIQQGRINKIVRTLPSIINNHNDALLIMNTFKDKLIELEVLPLLERKFFKPPPTFAMCDEIVCQYKDGKWRHAVIYAIRHEMIYIHFKQISLKENMAISVYDPRLYPESTVEVEPTIPTGWYCYCDMNMHLNEFNIEKCNNCGATHDIITE